MASGFQKGQRVEMTEVGHRTFRQMKDRSDHGRVVSVLSDRFIRVQRDGIKQPERWSVIYWQPEAPTK